MGSASFPGPFSLWLDARGRRLPVPLDPGHDTLGTLEHLRRTGSDHSWFIPAQSIIRKELALSGSEQNPDITGRDRKLMLRRMFGAAAPAPVEAFKRRGADFVVRDDLEGLVAGMNALAGGDPLDAAAAHGEVEARNREIANVDTKDSQIMEIHGARRYWGDRLMRTARPHRLLDPRTAR